MNLAGSGGATPAGAWGAPSPKIGCLDGSDSPVTFTLRHRPAVI